MRIALIAPPFYDVPPQGYGGVETVLAQLADGLVDRGHDVTLVGAGRDGTRARFVTTFDEPQHALLGRVEPELVHAARVNRILDDLDVEVVHDHSALGGIAARGRRAPTVFTCHGQVAGLWRSYLEEIDKFVSLVAISHSQLRLTPTLRWAAMVHNSIDTTDIPFRRDKEDFVVWLGRMSPDKGAHTAIDVAREAGRHLVLAAKCSEPSELDYFEQQIKPRLGGDVEYLGEIEEEAKFELLGSATALLFPLEWDEPFGMVLLEAMACGTPVVTMNRGAIDEIVHDGVTGRVVDSTPQLVEALGRLDGLDPAACRAHVEEHFSPARMVEGYEAVYRACLSMPAARPA